MAGSGVFESELGIVIHGWIAFARYALVTADKYAVQCFESCALSSTLIRMSMI